MSWANDYAWIGEHHSAGFEIIASPELFIRGRSTAHPAYSLRYRRLVTALSSPVHARRSHHATRPYDPRQGLLFGVGPGALPSDAFMLGINPLESARHDA